MTPSPTPVGGPAPQDPRPEATPAVEGPPGSPHAGSSLLYDVQRPADVTEGSPEDPAPRYTVSAVARRLGVAPATLRTWARRYGLGPSEHTTGAHRRYSEADLARLRRMRRLTMEGVTPADAARLALSDAAPAPIPTPASRPVGDLPRPEDEEAPDAATTPPARAGGPGGRVLAMPAGSPAARGLARAAMALDDDAVTALLREHLRAEGVVATWERVLAPVLVAVGQRWAATGEGVDVEHLLSECAGTVLREVTSDPALTGAPRPALLACTGDDRHALPLHVLAAGLAERGVAARVLGAAVPAPALASAVRRTGPVALFLWSQVRATADTAVLTGLPALRPPVTLLVGGPGWPVADLPPDVAHVRSLPEAIEAVVAATGR